MDDSDYLWKTNASKVTSELSAEILKKIPHLKKGVENLEKALQRRKPDEVLDYGWITNIEEDFASIRNNVGRINGAVLVRGTK